MISTQKSVFLLILLSLFCTTSMAVVQATTLDIVTYPNNWVQPMLEEKIKAFEALNPGVKVNLLLYGNHQEQMLINAAAGVKSDVYLMGGVTSATVRSLLAQGVTQDIAPFLAKDRELVVSDIYPLVMPTHTYKGHIVALPIGILVGATFANTTMFQEAGVALPGARWDWSNLVTIGRRLTKTASDGTIAQWGYGTNTWNLRDAGAELFVWANGGDILDATNSRFTLDQPEAVEALRFFYDLHWVHNIAFKPGSGEPYTTFWAGKLAIFDSQSGNISYNRQRSVAGMDWDVLSSVRSPKTDKAGSYLNAYSVGIPATSTDPALAWQFIKFAFYTDEAERQLVGYGMLPPLMRFGSYFARNIGRPPANIDPILQNATEGGRTPVWFDNAAVDKQMWDTLAQQWNRVMSNSLSVDGFIQTVKPIVESLLTAAKTGK